MEEEEGYKVSVSWKFSENLDRWALKPNFTNESDLGFCHGDSEFCGRTMGWYKEEWIWVSHSSEPHSHSYTPLLHELLKKKLIAS